MKRFLIAALLIVVALTTTSFAQSMSTANEVAPMPVVTSPIITFLVMATPTMTLASTTSANVLVGLPAGTKGFYVAPTTQVDINFGGSNVVSGAGWPRIAALTGSEPQKLFFCSPHVTPTMYFYPNATGTTPTIRITPFK